MEKQPAITVGHLLQLQRDLTQTIREELAATKGELRADIASTRADLREELVQVKAKQDIANGRTSRLERATANLRARADSSTVWRSLSKTQKASLIAKLAILGPLLFELLHRAIPVLLAMLGPQTPPKPALPPVPVERHAESPEADPQ